MQVFNVLRNSELFFMSPKDFIDSVAVVSNKPAGALRNIQQHRLRIHSLGFGSCRLKFVYE